MLGDVSILYTKRAGVLNSHSGEVSFPGGKADGDETEVEAALREVQEEVNIQPENIEVWGTLPPLASKNGITHNRYVLHKLIYHCFFL